jgi:hypothetical protein
MHASPAQITEQAVNAVILELVFAGGFAVSPATSAGFSLEYFSGAFPAGARPAASRVTSVGPWTCNSSPFRGYGQIGFQSEGGAP